MARRDEVADGEMGSDENIEPDPDEEARRLRFETAARQGADQLAAVVDQGLNSLADEFDTRVFNRLKEFGEEFSDALSPDRKASKSQFVAGAVFGAFVLAAGVLLGRGGRT